MGKTLSLLLLLCAAVDAAVEYQWDFVGAPSNGNALALAVAPSNQNILYAAGGYGMVFVSEDGGNLWRGYEVDGTRRRIVDLAVDPQCPTTVYASIFPGGYPAPLLYKSEDGARSWFPLEGVGGDQARVLVSPSDPQVVYVEHGRSEDGGLSWEPVEAPLRSPENLPGFIVHPLEPLTVFWATHTRIFRSRDGARTWEQVAHRAVKGFAFDPQDPRIIYAAGDSQGVIKSEDGGDTWTPNFRGLTYESFGDIGVRKLSHVAVIPTIANESMRPVDAASTSAMMRLPTGIWPETCSTTAAECPIFFTFPLLQGEGFLPSSPSAHIPRAAW